MTYKDIFKRHIENKFRSDELYKSNMDSVFYENLDTTREFARVFQLDQVDDITLKSYFDQASSEFLSVNTVDPGFSSELTKKGFETWLTEEKQDSIEWDYSDRYFEYLGRTGRSKKVVTETKRSSLTIMQKLANPNSSEESYVKGLVVGAVQSGKTGNFNAVINRSIDTGYRLIIVLSGIMEDLRSQTQKRIDKDVVGEGKGVGDKNGIRFGPNHNGKVVQIKSITSEQSDFNKQAEQLDFSLNAINILVCKKNVSVLKNLMVWIHSSLGENKKHDIPFLILDDEADNASLNNLGSKGKDYASKTNLYIRSILNLFKVRTYLGYTATPFANVLQDRNEASEKDLVISQKINGESQDVVFSQVPNIFPDDFIVLLEPPSNYIGAKSIFRTIEQYNEGEIKEKLPLIGPPISDHIDYFPSRVRKDDGTPIIKFQTINQWEEFTKGRGFRDFDTFQEYRKGTRASKKYDNFPEGIPQSLKRAILAYIISLAIRESRKPKMEGSNLFNPHNTMLIHISRFTLWQNKTAEFVKKYLDEVTSQINNDKPSEGIYADLEKLFYNSDYKYSYLVENIRSYLPSGYEDPFLAPIVFKSLKDFFPLAVTGIEVKAINSQTKEKLIYPKGNPKKYIAIGGNRLSRGFTLEGLTINYFVRETNYSDTLLQMGRWFGYRPGYLDCCRIFTTQKSIDSFDLTTTCIQELEQEFLKMSAQRKEPRKFILRVKEHPGALQVTRASIRKNATSERWSYQDSLVQATNINISRVSLNTSWKYFKSKIAPNMINFNSSTLMKWDCSSDEVLDLLRSGTVSFSPLTTSTMISFIEKANEKDFLTTWSIALKKTGSSSNRLLTKHVNLKLSIDKEIRLAKRPGSTRLLDVQPMLEEKIYRAGGRSANIKSDNKDLAFTLSDDIIKAAEEKFLNEAANKIAIKDKLTFEEALRKVRGKNINIPERVYREEVSSDTGLLLIYLIDSNDAFHQNEKSGSKITKEVQALYDQYVSQEDIDPSVPLLGYVFGFPPLEDQIGGVYLRGDYDIIEEDEDVEDELPKDIDDE